MITRRSTLTNLIALYLTSLLLADADEEKDEEVEDEEPSKSDEGISEEPEIDWTPVELANDDYLNDDDDDTYEFMFEEDDEEESADSTTEVNDENYKPDTNLADKNAEWEAQRGTDDDDDSDSDDDQGAGDNAAFATDNDGGTGHDGKAGN